MATSAPPPLAERLDIHKSCKSFETLLSVFNDYCEAAGAVVTLQKKMAKALKETAGMKVTGELAANALNASATIFETLSEVDSKFAKLADKEYDGISSDVKKWFRKLAKEEKAHDERIALANAKIKQAGLIYEKKSKKSPREANEEHARYINLISAVGPEISQEKYNHSLQVTERHTATTYSIVAGVSRVADAEWLRSCESVRRFVPTIGKLNEWRAYCEGGWTGPIPQDMRDIEPLPLSSDQDLPTPRRLDYDEEQYFPNFSFSWQNDDNTGSVRSLSQFPAPPTHFPLPPPLAQRQTSPAVSSPSSNPNRLERRSEVIAEKPESSKVQSTQFDERPAAPTTETTRGRQSLSSTPSSSPQSSKSFPRGDHLPATKEEQNQDSSKDFSEMTRASSSSGSIVAAIRSRYSQTSSSGSPPPKDIPRLPLSVNDLATRYQPPESPTSPKPRPQSPSGSQRRRQQQRLNQQAELEIYEKERMLKLREQEIELRSQELEREKAMLVSRNEAIFTREPEPLTRNAQPALRPRERHLSFQQPLRPAAPRTDPYAARPSSQYSASTTHLIPPQSPPTEAVTMEANLDVVTAAKPALQAPRITRRTVVVKTVQRRNTRCLHL
ncbi:hypothetical protein BDP27DRAFT_1391012 [Rhodocollybia butyracea]|uniref:Uncharacterized protein n=1 Tax=Rhodocollybia butyracea TaxID=206335 RepID=A0A9P5UAU6_9AGAR|nr:hypothetical protein BDP27DRAFT_1391012 [Rhodocollybia butyracea]